MLAAMANKRDLINPDEWRTITQAAAELGVDRSRVVKLTKELRADGRTPRLPTREFFGVQVIHVNDLDGVRVRTPGRPPLKAVEPAGVRRRRP